MELDWFTPRDSPVDPQIDHTGSASKQKDPYFLGCPFCGKKPQVMVDGRRITVICVEPRCHAKASVTGRDKLDAAHRWNGRSR
jgi:hypothetical protein